jgi:HPr kinase/phosphorylase
MEIRGLGVIDVARLFGVQAILEEQQVDLIVHLEAWAEGKEYDRLGLDARTTPILGVDVPTLLVPVRLGRNIAVIVEGGAIHHRLKMMGHDAAREFSDGLQRWIEGRPQTAPEVGRPPRRFRRRPVRPRRPKR